MSAAGASLNTMVAVAPGASAGTAAGDVKVIQSTSGSWTLRPDVLAPPVLLISNSTNVWVPRSMEVLRDDGDLAKAGMGGATSIWILAVLTALSAVSTRTEKYP